MEGVFYCLKCNKKRFFEAGLCGVCGMPYKEYVTEDYLTSSGEEILNCGVNFDPELIICRGSRVSKPCKYARDCYEYHSLNYEDWRKYYGDENENE